ncbi:TetR family transcriptional regulator [Streptomyces sp. NPDC055037]
MSSPEAEPLRVEAMTSRQLIRRAKLIEAVIDLVGEVGGQAVQMRDVAERSGVALGTAYRYFRSKDQLLAAALVGWQERLTHRVLSAAARPEDTPYDQVVDYLTRGLRAFHRNRGMALLMVQTMSSDEPGVAGVMDQMHRNSEAVWQKLLADVEPADAPYIARALDSTQSRAITSMVIRGMSVDEATDLVRGVARLLLATGRQ